jgi:arylsulfatase A-like enzyme
MKFILLFLGVISLGTIAFASDGNTVTSHPNVLFIIVDQQNFRMLSCAGNPWVKTPNMDSVAASGTRFGLAYCADPVCVPSRFSMLTGVMPSRIGMETNDDLKTSKPSAQILENALGRVFAAAGYETVYGGKQHVPMSIGAAGFRNIENDDGAKLAATCAKFLHQPHARPFLLVSSFINPHDICYMAISYERTKTIDKVTGPELLRQALETPAGVSKDDFFAKDCPPLPDNYAIPPGEPQSILAADTRLFRVYAREHWTDHDWRMHRWAYARLTETVDGQIGSVLAALRETGLDNNTLVLFTADHGDMDASHRLEHKSVLYEEATRVPMIVRWRGVTRPGAVDHDHLVSTGLDLIPTMCDFAHIPIPPGLKGHSLRPLAEGEAPADWRQTLVVENGQSRLLRSAKYKYCVYASGARREVLTDIIADPGEMKNLALDPAYASVLVEQRRLLKEWYEQNGEKLDPQYVITEK